MPGRGLLILCLPALVLLAGLPALLRGGQVDAMRWALPAMILLTGAGVVMGRRQLKLTLWLAVGTAGSVALLCLLAAGRPPSIRAMLLLLILACASCAGGVLLRSRWLAAFGLLSAAGLIWFAGRAEPVRQARDRPALAVITALPLFWREGEHGLAARSDAPVIALLRRRFEVQPLDSALSPDLRKARLLLLAQPRGMEAAELVAVDHWVRQGGQALILADPMLRWPSPLPLGDRRRAPPVSLLGPLLDHWGVRLAPAEAMGEQRHFLPDGSLLTVVASSRFEVHGGRCRAEASGLIARCRIGLGRVVLVADADMIDDRLWLADPDRPFSPQAWSADTPALVTQWLGRSLPGERQWVRSGEHLIRGVRWVLLAGMIWAGLGWALFGRGKGWILHRPFVAQKDGKTSKQD
ncbi:MAG: Gldg family protein [Sphingobium sp.]